MWDKVGASNQISEQAMGMKHLRFLPEVFHVGTD
jgi:hypothetical protein